MEAAPEGTNLAILSTSGYFMSSALPTSRMAALLFIRSKVIICATWERPYFSTMISRTRSLPRSDISVSISGMLILSGLRNLSKSKPYLRGSISVILRE